jgi:predicted nucleic acid-binding protein
MILADTSVWVDHLRKRDAALVHLLDKSEIVIHPFIVGELALGNLRHRQTVLETLNLLPSAVVASHEETLEFIEKNQLQGFGIGYVDAHLLAATRLTAGATIWTRDRKLHSAALRLALAAKALS